MYCIHCGAPTQQDALYCSHCGAKIKHLTKSFSCCAGANHAQQNFNKGAEQTKSVQTNNAAREPQRYCKNCGLLAKGEICLRCGASFRVSGTAVFAKSRLAAGLLGLFLGGYGAHNFYMGYYTKAIIQVCLFGVGLLSCFTIVGMIIGIPMMIGAGIWGLVEGVLVLMGIPAVDSHGIPLE